ncbi:hypothetical protein L1987_69485 [Smallanthus sonchifolius]|uniref:Uncharacterized protein n=1 Tax=Smallanthus sonchifolius TaxID=185202 RepID=A0ACB9B5K3_9ASTR|nr:hypothetical protein L1987_69485 [Smallanthus sonchifolius]
MVMRQSKDFLKKTGRKYIGSNSRTRMGFDKSKVRYYNCQEYGHFAKECVKPKVEFDSSGSGNSNHASTSSTLVAQNVENYDCGIHLEDLVGAVSQAFVAEIYYDNPEGTTYDNCSSDGESLKSDDEESVKVHNVDSDISSASGVSEDEIVLTTRSAEEAISEEIPIAKDKMQKKNKEISDKESEVIKLHQKLESFGNSSVLLDYFYDNADPTKRAAGDGFVPPPFNGNYAVEPEIIKEEEIDPKTVLKVEGVPKEVKLDEPKVVKQVTRDRCILTEPDEVLQPNLSKMLLTSGFVSAGHDKKTSSKVSKQVYVPKKKVESSLKSSEEYSYGGSLTSRKSSYVRDHRDKRVCFHCNAVGHILIHCPYKNQEKKPMF